MELASFEIVFGSLPPVIPNLQAKVIAEFEERDLLDVLWGVQWFHKRVA